MYRYKTFLYCTPTSRILHQMALKANQYDRIWFLALELLHSCFGPLNRCAHAIFGPKTGKMALMYKQIPMGGVVSTSL